MKVSRPLFSPSLAQLTSDAQVEENFLGQFLQATYVDDSAPTPIDGLDFPVANLDQLLVRADAAGEGVTIVSSTMALLSGLFPPTPAFNITLANGTTVVGALGGNQFIPGPHRDMSKLTGMLIRSSNSRNG